MEVEKMLKIGDFSKLSRVSIRMLRHYDDIGLLKPAEIDEFTGYRYYQEEQLFIMGRITALKDMGFAEQHVTVTFRKDFNVDKPQLKVVSSDVEQQ